MVIFCLVLVVKFTVLSLFLLLSSGERPISIVLSDVRFWVIHAVTITSLFLSGAVAVISGLVFKLFGAPSLSQFFKDSNQVPIVTGRYSALSESANF